MKAQMARGADFETGNIIRRAKAMIPLLVPLFEMRSDVPTSLQRLWRQGATTAAITVQK